MVLGSPVLGQRGEVIEQAIRARASTVDTAAFGSSVSDGPPVDMPTFNIPPCFGVLAAAPNVVAELGELLDEYPAKVVAPPSARPAFNSDRRDIARSAETSELVYSSIMLSPYCLKMAIIRDLNHRSQSSSRARSVEGLVDVIELVAVKN